ncbi:FAD dependent oxidoreductase superfamily [Grosmannia clavigera kw1407]|uniref:FAD dependent oxidoreductase superfamily n=1 Tax=Grosmannia clavigera (strain kw1407 / UAMH 11150) TaxID=655863 RepID=F0XDG0_GROCL|nr:FAD dependent oxidoreductase superfamily [Grosmannia clavigera kw1407]EFX04378.1 FAD dependent oxidoreductase superfamily [Grosmannia clavigera kw1407]
MPVQIAVIGAGITGLSAALRLVEELGDTVEVTVVARDFPAPAESFFFDAPAAVNFSSPWAGAHNRWVLWVADGTAEAAAQARDHGFALATYRHMQAVQAQNPEAGITFLPGIEYLEAPGPEYTQLADEAVQTALGFHDADLGLGFRLLGADEFPAAEAGSNAVVFGLTYRTWCVNPMVYCAFLLRRFSAAGGHVQKRELRSPSELLQATFDLVVNCSGNGFGDDTNMFITRGQTCLVRNRCDATVTRQSADGSWSFSVPRFYDGGTIIGGTKEPDNWDATPSLAVREHLLSRFAATYPSVLQGGSTPGRFDVIADVVGRRPTRRGGMRLETEATAKGPIVHAYGVGGRGYEISWGVAGAVVGLVQEQLKRTGRKPFAASL